MAFRGACLRMRLGRAKGGQTAWSPNRGPTTGPSGTSGGMMTANEQQKMMFRPLPRDHTVEYEEDFGANVAIHREYIGPTMEQDAPARLHALGRSRTEVRDLRRDIASRINKTRNAAVRNEADQPRFMTATDDNDPVGTVASARFLFDEKRLAFLDRFNRHFGDNPRLHALGEACAVLYGADADRAEVARSREAWFHEFLGLDRVTLIGDAEKAAAVLGAAEGGIEVSRDPHRRLHEALSDGGGDNDDADEAGALDAEFKVTIPGEVADFGALYANYAAYCAGKTRAVTPGVARDTLSAPTVAHMKATWREIMEAVAEEDFHRVASPEALAAAEGLSARLGTVRLFDAKLGEIVKESAQIVRAGDMPTPEHHKAAGNPDGRARARIR